MDQNFSQYTINPSNQGLEMVHFPVGIVIHETTLTTSTILTIMSIIKKEPIPEHFEDDEKAGDFWDTHSAADYWDEMEETEMEFDIQKRRFLVPIDDRVYKLAKKQAKEKDSTVEEIINNILDHSLTKI